MKPANPLQQSLFDSPALRLGAVGRAVKLALNQAVAGSNLSREEIVHRAGQLAAAAGVNLCPGGRLGLDTLNKWLDVNALGHMPSLNGLLAICQVLGDASAFGPALAALDLKVMGREDQKYCELGRTYLEEKKIRRRRREVEAEL